MPVDKRCCLLYVPNRWWFSGGLYMMKLNPHDLRLTALYGLVLSITVICLGSLVGHWIDKTKRLTGNLQSTILYKLRRFKDQS